MVRSLFIFSLGVPYVLGMGAGTSVVGYVLALMIIGSGMLIQVARLSVVGFWFPVCGSIVFAAIDLSLSWSFGGLVTFGDTIIRTALVVTFVTTACYARSIAGDEKTKNAAYQAIMVWAMVVLSMLILWLAKPGLLNSTNMQLVGLHSVPPGYRSFLFLTPEPGQSAMVLTLMAWFTKQMNMMKSNWLFWLFVTAALCTLSATAVLLLCLLAVATVFDSENGKKNVVLPILLLSLLLVALIASQGPEAAKVSERLVDLATLNFEGSSGTSHRLKQILWSYEQVITFDFFRAVDGAFSIGFAGSLNHAPLSTVYFLIFGASFLRVWSMPLFAAALVFIPLASPASLLFAIGSFMGKSGDTVVSPKSENRKKGNFA